MPPHRFLSTRSIESRVLAFSIRFARHVHLCLLVVALRDKGRRPPGKERELLGSGMQASARRRRPERRDALRTLLPAGFIINNSHFLIQTMGQSTQKGGSAPLAF